MKIVLTAKELEIIKKGGFDTKRLNKEVINCTPTLENGAIIEIKEEFVKDSFEFGTMIAPILGKMFSEIKETLKMIEDLFNGFVIKYAHKKD